MIPDCAIYYDAKYDELLLLNVVLLNKPNGYNDDSHVRFFFIDMWEE